MDKCIECRSCKEAVRKKTLVSPDNDPLRAIYGKTPVGRVLNVEGVFSRIDAVESLPARA